MSESSWCDCAEKLEEYNRRSRIAKGYEDDELLARYPSKTRQDIYRATSCELRGTPSNLTVASVNGPSSGPFADSWIPVLASTAIFLGLCAFLYRTFDVGSIVKRKFNAVIGHLLLSICQTQEQPKACGVQINPDRRKWTITEFEPNATKPYINKSYY